MLTFNPDGILNGANDITIVGTYAYICCDAGLVVVRIDDPKKPEGDRRPRRAVPEASVARCRRSSATPSSATRRASRCSTSPTWRSPGRSSRMKLPDAHNIYLARTYAYVAAGKNGLVILDIENPDQPQDRPGLQRRRLHQRPARREAGHHLRQRVRLPGRRQERHARRAADRRRTRRATTASARGRRRS